MAASTELYISRPDTSNTRFLEVQVVKEGALADTAFCAVGDGITTHCDGYTYTGFREPECVDVRNVPHFTKSTRRVVGIFRGSRIWA